jgi:tetratricopeptide (TPR) repeat protein
MFLNVKRLCFFLLFLTSTPCLILSTPCFAESAEEKFLAAVPAVTNKTIASLTQEIEAKPTDWELLRDRGLIYLRGKDPFSAGRDFKRSITLLEAEHIVAHAGDDPSTSSIKGALASLYTLEAIAEMDQDHFKLAFDYCNQAISKDSRWGDLYRVRAAVHLKLGRKGKAAADEQAAATVDAGLPLTH